MSAESELLEAAARGDELGFARLARSIGGIERAQELVRGGTSVARVGSPGGQTRSMPELRVDGRVPPPREAGRGKPRHARTSAGPSPVVSRLLLTRFAERDLRELLYEFDGDEVGGPMYGEILSDGTILIERVYGPTSSTERSPHHIRIERDHCLDLELPGQRWVGDWHSHREREPRPSQADFEGWRAAVRSELGVYAGVVATVWLEDEDWADWSPRFSAWVATRDGGCVPATIEVEAERRYSWQH
jgi:Prokaryotic homologs of the JAB domain